VKQGKLQCGSQVLPVKYTFHTNLVPNQTRKTSGKLIVPQLLGGELTATITNTNGVSLITEDNHVLWIEFTTHVNGKEIEFSVSPRRRS
jgi:hypothetical protein